MTVFGFSDLAFMGAAAGYAMTDADAAAYITAVETADGQALEPGVRRAINEFVIGCKADGIWNAVKASCILAGARTLAGALVPLVGAAPTNFNFVSGDYNRKTGLVGDGSTKYLDTNRSSSADPQDNNHLSCFASLSGSSMGVSGAAATGDTAIIPAAASSWPFRNRISSFTTPAQGTRSVASAINFIGMSRSGSSTFQSRVNNANETITSTSTTTFVSNHGVFTRLRSGNPTLYSNARLAFYSIGEALDLALLDARVTALMYGIQKTLLEGDFDIDAAAYISRVETADGQDLEPAVRTAINDFVVGCKADGIWNAVKASCILAGARTLAGALVPLVGAAPTNFNFVSGDYNRKTGLVGDGNGLGVGTKYLNSNRAGNADPQNNRHVSAYVSTVATYVMIGSGSSTGRTQLSEGSVRLASDSPIAGGVISSGTFTGGSRESASTVIRRINGASVSASVNSETPSSLNYAVFARNTSTGIDFYANHRLAFYSIGESLNLALLDARVTTLINAFAAAIP